MTSLYIIFRVIASVASLLALVWLAYWAGWPIETWNTITDWIR